MVKLIPISGRKLCKILEKLGFEKIHQAGSHARYLHHDGRISEKIMKELKPLYKEWTKTYAKSNIFLI